MFAQLGTYKFDGLKAPGSFNETFAVKYGRIPLINGKDDIQPTGEELAEVDLSVQYSAEFCDPATEINALKASARKHEVLPLIMGDGTIVGNFVITNIDTTKERFSPTGKLETARVYVSLLERAGVEEQAPVGLAVESQNPPSQIPAAPVPTEIGAITEDLKEGQNTVNAIKAVAADVKKGTTDLKRGVRQARRLADDATRAYNSAKNKIVVTQKVIKRAADLPGSIDDILPYLENLAKLDNVMDFSVLENDVEQVSMSADKITIAAAPVVAFAASRERGI